MTLDFITGLVVGFLAALFLAAVVIVWLVGQAVQ